MTAGGARLVTEQRELLLGRRITAIAEELHEHWGDKIEKPRRGRVEITIDFANGSLVVSVREVGESRRIE